MMGLAMMVAPPLRPMILVISQGREPTPAKRPVDSLCRFAIFLAGYLAIWDRLLSGGHPSPNRDCNKARAPLARHGAGHQPVSERRTAHRGGHLSNGHRLKAHVPLKGFADRPLSFSD